MYQFKPEDVEAFANYTQIKHWVHGNEMVFEICPYCKRTETDNRRKFSINLKTGQFECKRSTCGNKGNMITLARDFNFKLSDDFSKFYERKREYRQLKQLQKPPEPKDPAITYLMSRGISRTVAERYHITCQDSKPDILVFPIYDENGKMVNVKYRNTKFVKGETQGSKEWFESNCMPYLYGIQAWNGKYDRMILTEGQCFDGEAEILTPDGWIRFEDYCGQDVLQVDEHMQGSFVRPKQFIVKRHSGNMVSCEIGGNYYTNTTDDHNLVFVTKKGKVIKKKASEKISSAYSIPTAINLSESKYKRWKNEMFALYIAVSADGSIDFRKNTGWNKPKADRYVRFGISLERKAKRLREILDCLEIKYSDTILANGYTSICFYCPEWLTSKYLPYGFATGTTPNQKQFIIEELTLWDGNKVKGRNQYEFTTIIKHNADVVQLIASTCGYMSTIMSKQNGGNGQFVKSYCYKVSILLNKNHVSTQQFENHKVVYYADQRVYCVTVDTGMILVRQKNKISVSGNCDCISVAEAGIENAFSVPGGARGFTWWPPSYQFVSKFSEIIIFGDYEKGEITLLEEMKQRFGGQIRHVREEDYLDCKDANDILQKYGKEQIQKCINNAILVPIKDVTDLADVQDVDISKLEKLPSGIKELDKLLYGGLPFGGVHIITGKSGCGKSTLASQFLVNAIENGYTCFAYSGELPNYLFKGWMSFQVAGGKHVYESVNDWREPVYGLSEENKNLISEWYRDKMYIFDNSVIDGNDESTNLIEIVRRVIQQYGVRVILLDNLMTAMTMEKTFGNDQYERQTDFMNKLRGLAVRYNVMILLVAHKRKNGYASDESDEIAGSSNIANLAMLIMTFSRVETDNNQEEKDTKNTRILRVPKNRLFGKITTDGFVLEYDERSRRLWNTAEERDKEYSWIPKTKETTTPDGFTQVDLEIPVFQ